MVRSHRRTPRQRLRDAYHATRGRHSQAPADHFLATLFAQQDKKDFHKTFDATLLDIAALNSEVFSVRTAGGSRIQLFDRFSEFISDPAQRDPFAKAIINKLITFSFEHILAEGFDFYSTLFEYLIKDYNSDAGGKYAKYYTPHAIAKIMAAILVPSSGKKLSTNHFSTKSKTRSPMPIGIRAEPSRCTGFASSSPFSSELIRQGQARVSLRITKFWLTSFSPFTQELAA